MTITISGTSGVTYPAGGTDNVAGSGVGTSDTQTLTNKTLTTPTIATIKSAASGTPTVFQDSAGTEIGTLCRAWVSFVGSTGTRNASFNVSSVTRTGVGLYTVNFATALPSANYSMIATNQPSSNSIGITYNPYASTNTASACYVRSATQNGGSSLGDDSPVVFVAVFG